MLTVPSRRIRPVARMRVSGQRIAARMEAMGLSSHEVAALIGSTRQSIEAWIAGTQPRGDNLVMLAAALETTVDELVEIDPE